MGYLLEGGYLDLDGVSVEFHYWILHVWMDAQKLIKNEQTDNVLYYQHFEKMVDRLLKYERPRTGVLPLPSLDEVLDFYIEESQLRSGSPIPKRKKSKRRTN